MSKEKVQIMFEDMTYRTTYRFLEEAKASDKKELEAIAKKRGIKLPSPDIAVFKGRYAFVDKQNKNGCTLPKKEVAKALDTLALKAVDIDHLRRSVVGNWLDAKIEGDEIITYGSFLKSNFKEEYDVFKSKMEEGVVKISFEAWGNRLLHNADDESEGYDLTDIHFAGGALLFDTKPAFDDAEVLEFAKIMEEGKPKMEKDKELSKYYVYDMEQIIKLVHEVKCPMDDDDEHAFIDILAIDFDKNTVKVKCLRDDTILLVDLTPSAKVVKKGRKIKNVSMVIDDVMEFSKNFKGSDELFEETIIDIFESEEGKKLPITERSKLNDDMFAIVKTVADSRTEGKTRKIRAFPIKDEVYVKSALARLGQSKVETNLGCLGVSVDMVEKKILQRAQELDMTDILESNKGGINIMDEKMKEKLEKEIAELKIKVADYEKSDVSKKIASLEKDLEEAKSLIEVLTKDQEKTTTEINSVNTEFASIKKERDEAVAKLDEIAKVEKATKIKARRDELGEEFAKDLSDEKILDDNEFKIASLTKENADLKDKVPAEGKKELATGSSDKTVDDAGWKKDQDNVQKDAWTD